MSFIKVASAVAREFAGSFLLNFIFIFIYLFIIYIIRTQYGRYTGLTENSPAQPEKTIKEFIKESAFYGAVTGFASSFAVIFLGITVDVQTFEYLYIIIIVLSMINIRYICFSYAGGILALAGIFLGLPKVSVPSLLALIAIMHFVESIMIYINSGKDSIPVLIKHGNNIAGAFFTQKYWPVPVVLLTFLNENRENGIANIISGKWWMPFEPDIIKSGAFFLGLGCIVAVLGYSDVAITRSPEKKNRETSLSFLIYSIVLFCLAIGSVHYFALKVAGALFAIAAHEGIILYGRYREKRGEPLFKTVKRGIKVFDILPDGHAKRMGMQRGDTILSINGRDVQTEEGMEEALRGFPTFVWISVVDTSGKMKTYEYKCYPNGINSLGIMTVPRENMVTYNIDYFENISVLKNLVARFRGTGRSF